MNNIIFVLFTLTVAFTLGTGAVLASGTEKKAYKPKSIGSATERGEAAKENKETPNLEQDPETEREFKIAKPDAKKIVNDGSTTERNTAPKRAGSGTEKR